MSRPVISTEQHTFTFGAYKVELLVPALEAVRQHYAQPGIVKGPVPYWAKLWPSAIALCRYIASHPELLANKNVLELAAGLGLPGLLATQIASTVIISDYSSEAVEFVAASCALNEGSNVQCRTLDWQHLPDDLEVDVLLLSDINYDPASFETLRKVLHNYLEKDTTILLSSPQWLMAKPFIERLLPHCILQEEESVLLNGEHSFISILILKQTVNI